MDTTNLFTFQFTRLPRIRRWPIRIISLLLLLQAVGLLGSCLYLFNYIDWEREVSDVGLSSTVFETIGFIVFFVPVAALILFSAIGFLFLWRVAWLTAMTGQGLSLFGSLAVYFESYLNHMKLIYLIMLYSIVM